MPNGGTHRPPESGELLVQRFRVADIACPARDLQCVSVDDRHEVVERVMRSGHRRLPVGSLREFAVSQERVNTKGGVIHLPAQRQTDRKRESVTQGTGILLDAIYLACRVAHVMGAGGA